MKAAAESDFLKSISPPCMHKDTGGVKAVSVDLVQSRWRAEPQPLLNFLLLSVELAVLFWKAGDSARNGESCCLDQIQVKAQSQPSNSQSLKRKNLPLQQLEEIENGLFIEV